MSLSLQPAAAGVHVATVCRWAAADPRFRAALSRAALAGYRLLHPARGRRPPVRVHPDCPDCGAPAVVRTAASGLRFWRCGTWPACRWASWRPRHPADCPDCDGPRFWSYSRRSVVCPRCRVRTTRH